MFHRYIETVFRSQACVNASFLLTDEKHYNCSSRQHGVDLELAARCFGMISEIMNETISELVNPFNIPQLSYLGKNYITMMIIFR